VGVLLDKIGVLDEIGVLFDLVNVVDLEFDFSCTEEVGVLSLLEALEVLEAYKECLRTCAWELRDFGVVELDKGSRDMERR